MKQRFFMLALILATVHTISNAQLDYYNGKRPIIIEDDEISHLVVSGNIGVVLRKETGKGTNVRMSVADSKKAKITLRDGKLFISAKENVPADQQLIVYAWTDDLESLTLTNKAMAAGLGVLNFHNLTVNVDKESKVSLKTIGKIRMNAPDNYQFTEKEQYYSVDTESR